MPLIRVLTAVIVALSAGTAHAHFKLLQPASWLDEDDLGGPQKGSPCGPGNARPFIGDDIKPVPTSGAVTSFTAGQTITVQWQETIYHPGYFRISIAKRSASAADSSDFPDPPLTDTENCHFDHAIVRTTPHDNVLADGLFQATEVSADPRSFQQQVELPDEACENCSLQVVQVMEGHPASSCFYFHCADIKITPKPAAIGCGCQLARGALPPRAASAGFLLAFSLVWLRRRGAKLRAETRASRAA